MTRRRAQANDSPKTKTMTIDQAISQTNDDNFRRNLNYLEKNELRK